MFIVDGGYLSWIYGTDASRINSWSAARSKYSRAAGALFMLDSPVSHRRNYYSDYKSRRRERTADDPERMARANSVRWFVREVWQDDPRLEWLQVEGFEADDLVSLAPFVMESDGPTRIVGADKDLLQLPADRISLSHHDGKRVTFESYKKNLPKTLLPYFRTPRDLLLVLTLLGDDSDSVPRLVPAGRLDLMASIMRTSKPFTAAFETWGPAVLRNLYLVALPGPWCWDPQPTPNELLYAVDYGDFPHGFAIKSELQESIKESASRILSCNK